MPSSHLKRTRRWWVKRFRTSVRPGVYNRHAGRIFTVEEWESGGGWGDALRPGWTVERPDWWAWGQTSAVTAETVEEARVRLDMWQDEMAASA
jgi:hypothetical protein